MVILFKNLGDASKAVDEQLARKIPDTDLYGHAVRVGILTVALLTAQRDLEQVREEFNSSNSCVDLERNESMLEKATQATMLKQFLDREIRRLCAEFELLKNNSS